MIGGSARLVSSTIYLHTRRFTVRARRCAVNGVVCAAGSSVSHEIRRAAPDLDVFDKSNEERGGGEKMIGERVEVKRSRNQPRDKRTVR